MMGGSKSTLNGSIRSARLPDESDIYFEDLNDWNEQMVQYWLNKLVHEYGKEYEIYKEVFRKHKVDGKKLQNVTCNQLLHEWFVKRKHLSTIWGEICEIKNYKKYVKPKKRNQLHRVDVRFQLVKEKMEKIMGHDQEKAFKFFNKVQAHCDPEEMMDTYLDCDWLTTKKLYNETVEQDGDDSDDSETEKWNEVAFKQVSTFNPDKNANHKIRVKIVITEIGLTATQQNVRRLLSPIITNFSHLFGTLDTINKVLPFGIFHSALIVGPWYLEWTDSEICTPRKIMSKAAIFSCDIDGGIELDNTTTLQSLSEKLAKVITKWNVYYKYTQVKSPDPNCGNCQDFVIDILKALGKDVNHLHSGVVGSYLEEMKQKGQCDMVFKMTESFRKEFKIEETQLKFDSHKKLDAFVQYLKKRQSHVNLTYYEEWKLLKSFDRAFWLRDFRHAENIRKLQAMLSKTQRGEQVNMSLQEIQSLLKNEKKCREITMPLGDPKRNQCPFGDPHDTQSFAVEKL